MNTGGIFSLIIACLSYRGHYIEKTYTLSAGYTVNIHGTLSIHNWSEKIEKVSGQMEANLNGDGSVDVGSIRIVMDARSIKSDMGSVMNKKTYKALKADANPQIIFLLTGPVKLTQITVDEKAVALNGDLTLAGESHPVVMLVRSFKTAKGTMSFEGEQKIKMTDFGIKPPSALFGTMKAGPDITIDFKTDFVNNE